MFTWVRLHGMELMGYMEWNRGKGTGAITKSQAVAETFPGSTVSQSDNQHRLTRAQKSELWPCSLAPRETATAGPLGHNGPARHLTTAVISLPWSAPGHLAYAFHLARLSSAQKEMPPPTYEGSNPILYQDWQMSYQPQQLALLEGFPN